MTKSGDLFALAATPLLTDQVRGQFSPSAGRRRCRVEENQRDGLPILRRPRQKRAVSPSGAATSQPRGTRLLELRIHQEGSKGLRRLDELRWREGEEVNDVGLCLFGEIRQVRFDDRVSFLGRHTLELFIDHTDANRCRVVAVRVDRLEPRVCQNFFDLAGFDGPSGFPRTRGGMRHGSCLSTQSYMAFAVFRKAVVSPVSRRPVSYRRSVVQSNRRIRLARSSGRDTPRFRNSPSSTSGRCILAPAVIFLSFSSLSVTGVSSRISAFRLHSTV